MTDTQVAGRALLECRHVSLRRGDREVVRDVSFDLRAGELVALLGPNGAGKSTLVDALGGALAPSQGEIVRHGRVAAALQAPDLARRSVLDNVKLALAWWGVPRAERAEQASAGLSTMRAEHLAQRAAATLSGGERRRVHLARVLALAADVLLLDEPFAGLDAEVRGTLLQDSVSALRSDTQTTLVVVHDRAEAWALADRLLILIGGELVATGPPRELLELPPTPAVARFLGYDGWLAEQGETVLTRPPDVVLDSVGPLEARVAGAVALEDGFRLELKLSNGRLFTVAALPAPRVGDAVRVRVNDRVRFPAAQVPLDDFAMLKT